VTDYTPTTEEVRNHYLAIDEDRAEFDRWLAEHERKAKESAYAEGYVAASTIRMGPTHNPYKRGRR
jgi:predicted acetyltransferase